MTKKAASCRNEPGTRCRRKGLLSRCRDLVRWREVRIHTDGLSIDRRAIGIAMGRLPQATCQPEEAALISRIYIDNYKCFTNFEYQPGALQLLLGANGTGKTAVFDVLDTLREFIVSGTTSLSAFPPGTLTAWDRRTEQRFELGLKGQGGEYLYRLAIEQDRATRKNRIKLEDLRFDGRPLYQFDGREAHLFRDDGTPGPVFPFDWSRSAIPTIPARGDNRFLTWFRWRLNRIFVFSPDPLRMTLSKRGGAASSRSLAPSIGLLDSASPSRVTGDLPSSSPSHSVMMCSTI